MNTPGSRLGEVTALHTKRRYHERKLKKKKKKSSRKDGGQWLCVGCENLQGINQRRLERSDPRQWVTWKDNGVSVGKKS